MTTLVTELARFVRLVVVGLLLITGAAVVIAGGILRARGTLTRQRVETVLAVLTEKPSGPPAASAPSAPPMPDEVAVAVAGRRLEAERMDLQELQMSLTRTAADVAASQDTLKGAWDELREQKKRAEEQTRGGEGRGAGSPARPAAAGAPAAALPATEGGRAPEGGDAFARAARVASRTDPRAFARTMLTWTAAGAAGGAAPDYDRMLRYLRALRDSQAAEVLEETARLPGPGGEPDFGLRVAGELQRRLGEP